MIFLAIFFVLSSGPNGDTPVQYTGMDQATITRLEAERGNTVQIIDEGTYTKLVEAHRQLVRDSEAAAESQSAQKTDAAKTILNDSRSTANQKLDALADYLKLKS